MVVLWLCAPSKEDKDTLTFKTLGPKNKNWLWILGSLFKSEANTFGKMSGE